MRGFFGVPKAGIEPARVLTHRLLRPTRLPIPPLRHVLHRVKRGCKNTVFFIHRKQVEKNFCFCLVRTDKIANFAARKTE